MKKESQSNPIIIPIQSRLARLTKIARRWQNIIQLGFDDRFADTPNMVAGESVVNPRRFIESLREMIEAINAIRDVEELVDELETLDRFWGTMAVINGKTWNLLNSNAPIAGPHRYWDVHSVPLKVPIGMAQFDLACQNLELKAGRKPIRTFNDTENAVVEALAESGRRLKGDPLANRAIGRPVADGHFKAILSALVKEGVLDNTRDCRGAGYGLSEWTTENESSQSQD